MYNLKQKTIEKFEELKNDLSNHTTEENYCELCNIAIDYDNEAQDDLYLHDTIHNTVDFIDEEILNQMIMEQAQYGISRLRCFIENTYDDNIYKLDVYGNLENVTEGDFIECIDECIDKLKNN